MSHYLQFATEQITQAPVASTEYVYGQVKQTAGFVGSQVVQLLLHAVQIEV